MAKPPLPDEVSQLLAKPNPCVITTLRPDGQPVSVATWYSWENGRVLVNMDEGRKRLEYMRADPRVSLTILDEKSWYTHVSLQGRVVALEDDVDLRTIDRLAKHYTGEQYPVRDRKRVNAWIEIDRWHGWGAAENKDVEHH
ncbi:PPOX class F420-dependent oxidoreductase [Saccharopolyspora rectivirgula]|uniref:F420-dependent oxidoreductase n=1 Tax=Saccharopolyspora rectivirgula TaxID=28042 RepID=A0A073B1I3_9PSEU|nr:PPOX class F420-dependent oxidoreductase [Saccharopolyspora rectivirgula]KEI45878.1 F420-dependent oxidoreductase [Saccharopolyspora rectivirgula]